MKKLYGVIASLTTPFDENGQVIVSALEEQVEFLIEKGVNCLYPNGTTGEMYLMTPEQRELVAKTVVEKANGRVTVFIHVGAMQQAETIRLAQHAQAIGADGIGVVTPSYFTVDDRAMITYYTKICQSLNEDFPVYAYGIPQLAHNDLSVEVLEEICKICPNFIGVKYSYPDFPRLMAYTQIREGDFSVVFGADNMFLPALCAGADGTVSGCSGPFPEMFVDIYKHYLAGDMQAAKAAQDKATKLVYTLKCGADMSIFKHILTWRGVTGGHMHEPLLDLTPEGATELYEKIKKYL